jgi:hypothetical protein
VFLIQVLGLNEKILYQFKKDVQPITTGVELYAVMISLFIFDFKVKINIKIKAAQKTFMSTCGTSCTGVSGTCYQCLTSGGLSCQTYNAGSYCR